MPGKKVACSNCSKIMRSDNLKRHTKICQQAKCYAQKRPLLSSEIFGSGKSSEGQPTRTNTQLSLVAEKPNEVQQSLTGKFLSPEETIAWRKTYVEGGDTNKILKQVQEECKISRESKTGEHKQQEISTEKDLPQKRKMKSEYIPLKRVSRVEQWIPIKEITPQGCVKYKTVGKPIYRGGGTSYIKRKRYGQKCKL